MEATAATRAVSDASVVPRVGVGVLVINENGYILLGKRHGSHGSGTLALPGGHLELHESFQDCAVREVLEETAIELETEDSSFQALLSPSQSFPTSPLGSQSQLASTHSDVNGSRKRWNGVQFVTAVNSVGMKDAGEQTTGQGRHYVTIFMKAKAKVQLGQSRVQAQVTEPEKCLGWIWVPWSYLKKAAEQQRSVQNLKGRAALEGQELPVSLDRLLEAERLANAIRAADDVVDFTRDRTAARSLANEANTVGRGPVDEQEAMAWDEADDFARGAPLFEPLVNFIIEHPDVDLEL